MSPTLPTQLYTAMLYTATTVVLIVQHLHYNNRRSDAATKRETEGAEDVHGRSHRLGDIENGDGDVWNDDAERGTDARPLLGRHRRDASGDASDDENKSSVSAAAFESVGSIFGTTPGSARTFALLGSVSHPSGPGRTPDRIRGRGRTAGRTGARSVRSPQTPAVARLAAAVVERGGRRDVGRGGRMGGAGMGGRALGGGARSGLTTSLAAAAATGSSLSVFSALANADAGRIGFKSEGSRRLLETSSEFIRAPLVRAPTWLGPALGWTMTAIYLSGRVPQIARNHARGSVEGLSVSMFALAVVGNATYLGSILARSTRWVTIAPNMPWIVDAGMCLAMDAVILAQSAWYGGCGGRGGWSGKSRDSRGSTHAPADSGYASDDESGSDESLLDPV